MHLIMVVDDDDDIRETLAAVMEEEGFVVLKAANGAEALLQLRSGARPCLIVLDLMMPVMDGWKFRAEQRADPELASIPVVVLSAATDVRRHAASMKVRDYLVKPVELPALLNTIERHC
jgi:CheY-like chemotaxis protein